MPLEKVHAEVEPYKVSIYRFGRFLVHHQLCQVEWLYLPIC